MVLLLGAGEVHDPDHLVRRVRLDEEAALGVEGRRRVARHPVAIGRQEIDRQPFGEDHVIERGLRRRRELRALQYLGQHPAPSLPMRRLGVQCEDAAIDHRVAAEPVGDPPAEGGAVALPGQGPAERFRPLVVALIGAVDLRGDRQPVAPGRGAIQLDDPPVLQPGVGVEPEIHPVSREILRQKGPGELGLQHIRRALAAGEGDVPVRAARSRPPAPPARRAPPPPGPRSKMPIATSGCSARTDSTASRNSGK